MDSLIRELFTEICRIPLIDPHSHINPHRPASRSLDDILGYHYYTELAHSAGMDQHLLGGTGVSPVGAEVEPCERVRAILTHMDRFDNTTQYAWFLEIARTFLDFQGERVTAADTEALWDNAERVMSRPDWESEVLRRSNIEKVFLTNDFDDPLEGFDTNRYVPCLRTDDLVFHLDKPEVRLRLAKATGIEIGDAASLRRAIGKLFEHFTRRGAKACAISLPPDFIPRPSAESFWMLAEHCREFGLPFDLMIGVNRRVYKGGVYQGQDLFDQRTSLLQYAELFNTFPEVTFCISVLSSGQNQELVSYSWIFPNVVTNGHWWYSNIPAYIAVDLRARLQAVPKTKQIGYYSDMYKLEFGLPKFNMYRRLLSRILADDFVRPGILSETEAVELARCLLRDNVERIFRV
ncbi:MAG TPA: glucuronate isomerase [Gemmataceae bacterium]|nr:glucuronate isomerase [Gemmataceae bacterium]